MGSLQLANVVGRKFFDRNAYTESASMLNTFAGRGTEGDALPRRISYNALFRPTAQTHPRRKADNDLRTWAKTFACVRFRKSMTFAALNGHQNFPSPPARRSSVSRELVP